MSVDVERVERLGADGYNAAVMESPSTFSRHPAYGIFLAMLVALVLLAFGLRLANLDAFSFWTDEGLTPLRSGYSISEILSNRVTIQEGVTRDTHPPFYYLVIHFTQGLFGQTDFAYRYPSLLAGVLLVPLLFQFGRRLQSMATGLFAALFTAVNSLQIYYGNEARMYTLYVLLAAAASYALWRALSGAKARRWLAIYVPLAGLALYTHYTAVFLIAVQGLFWIWLLWRAGYKRLIAGLGIVALLLAIPIIPFTIPRIFSGVEANYSYVQPLIMLQDVARFFTLGVTVDFRETLASVFIAAALILAAVGLWSADSWLKRFFLLGYLLAVVLGLMAGSFIKPMYQGVRHIMVGSPAFLLLLAMGADYLWSRSKRLEGMWRAAVRTAGALLVAAVLLGSIYALNNLYNDPSFAKDDFRAMIAYIEGRAGQNDVVLYHNAILLPLHEHYQTRQDLDVTAAPVYPYSADGVEEQLAALAGEYERIWFTTDPPADDRDLEERVPAWLKANLQDVDNESFHARTTVVHTTGYRSAPTASAELPADSRALALEWPDMPPLLGVRTAEQLSAGGGTTWIDLFWQGTADAPVRNTTLRLWLEDEEGNEWGRFEQALSDDFAHWPAGDVQRESYKLPVPVALPPGPYNLMAQPLDSDGGEIGEAVMLAKLRAPPAAGLPDKPSIIFENGLTLHKLEWFEESIHPGHNMLAALTWQSPRNQGVEAGNLRYEIDVVAPGGDVVRTIGGKPGGGIDTFPADTAVREVTSIYFPPDSEIGEYKLWWRLYDGDTIIDGRPIWRPWFSDNVVFGVLDVTPWPISTALPGSASVLEAQFGPAIELYGYELGDAGLRGVPLTLTWRATAAPDGSYVVFVHLVDAETGDIVAQVDRLPLEGLRPTSGWRAGEVISDQMTLSVAGDLPAGTYDINVGVYDPESGGRLPVMLDGERQPHDQLHLDSILLP